MNKVIKYISLVIVIFVHFFSLSNAQQKLGGEYDVSLKKSYCTDYKDSINWIYVKEPDSIPSLASKTHAETTGFAIPINKNFFELATKLENASNNNIFLLRITQEKAYNTFLYFGKYNLPEGALITFLDINGVLLDQNKYPPYDSDYNREEFEEGLLTWNIPSDVIVMFTCKMDDLKECSLFLERIFFGYKDLSFVPESKKKENLSPNSNLQIKSSQSCDFSVPCFNDYTYWFNEINSVIRIEYFYSIGNYVNWYRSSGVFLNTPNFYNSDDSKKPFILTAAHVLDILRADGQDANRVFRETTRLYLLYQKTSCGGNAGNPPLEAKGLNIIFEGQRSSVNDFANDYLLLQLRKTEITDLKKKGNVTFAGYDANSKSPYDLQASVPTYCFHHPEHDGPDKKYMRFNNIVNNSNGYYAYYNDQGFSQKGSSGSPVFDKNHFLIGLVAGGDSNTCANPTYQRPVGPKFSYIFQNISQYLGTEETIAYSYDPIYAHPPAHCRNCALDEALGEVEADCGGPCKPCGQWYEENVSINNERLLANVIQAKTVTTTSGNNITLKNGETSNIFFSESLTLNAGFSVEQGANFSTNTKTYSEPINQVCEAMCTPAIPHMICEGYSWFCRAPNTTWVTVKIYQANARRTSYTKIYEDSFPNFTNEKIILWDGLTGVQTGVNWDNTRQYIIELQLQDCEGSVYSINFDDTFFLAFRTSGCSS